MENNNNKLLDLPGQLYVVGEDEQLNFKDLVNWKIIGYLDDPIDFPWLSLVSFIRQITLQTDKVSWLGEFKLHLVELFSDKTILVFADQNFQDHYEHLIDSEDILDAIKEFLDINSKNLTFSTSPGPGIISSFSDGILGNITHTPIPPITLSSSTMSSYYLDTFSNQSSTITTTMTTATSIGLC